MKVFFLIRSVERGGAERQVVELTRGLVRAGVEVCVCTFYDGGALRGELEAIPGLAVLSLGKRGRWDIRRSLLRLHREVQARKPDVVHGYMAFANELALLAGRASRAAVVWGLRASNVSPTLHDGLGRAEISVATKLSGLPDAIIVNSEAGRAHHRRLGFCDKRMFVVPNGIDCDRFRPDFEARFRLRREWGVSEHEKLIGIVARISPVKDHKTFLKAAARVANEYPHARFACVGHGSTQDVADVRALAASLPLGDRLIWTGGRDDMSAVYNALDVLALSSVSEGFPNVVAEAMATEKVCVVTNVGDAARIVSEFGTVVPISNPEALAKGLTAMLALPASELSELGTRGRHHIEQQFSISALIRTTKILLEHAARRDLDNVHFE